MLGTVEYEVITKIVFLSASNAANIKRFSLSDGTYVRFSHSVASDSVQCIIPQ